MKQKLKYLLPVLLGSAIVGGVIWAANTFPTTLNDWEYGETIEEDWADALETTIGITNSADTASHDYLIRQRLTINYASSTYLQIGFASSTYLQIPFASTTYLQIPFASSTYLGIAFASTTYLQIPFASSTYLGIAFASTTYLQIPFASSTYLQLVGGTLTGSLNGKDIALTDGLSAATTTLTGLLTVGTITTGIGETEIYQMNQAVRTTDAVLFKDIVATYGLTAATSSFTGIINADGGFISTASSTITTSLDLPNINITGANWYPAFTYSTTSFSGTTTVALGSAYTAETWFGARCTATSTGSVSLRFQDLDGNMMNWIVASTTDGLVSEKTLTTNNTYVAGEPRFVQMGSPAGTVSQVSCTIKKQF